MWIGAERTGELRVAEDAHDLEEIHLPFIRKYFLEIVKASLYVAHVDLIDLAALAQILDDRKHFGFWILQSLGGCAETQLKSVVRAVYNGLVSFDRFEYGRRIPVIRALISERQTPADRKDGRPFLRRAVLLPELPFRESVVIRSQ